MIEVVYQTHSVTADNEARLALPATDRLDRPAAVMRVGAAPVTGSRLVRRQAPATSPTRPGEHS